MTTIYLLRHSQPFRNLLGEYNANEKEQIRNEKNPLSVEGEFLAQKISKLSELNNIDVLYSSHYVRAMSTAKYIAENNNINLNVDERLGERKFGISNINSLPKEFFEKQFRNFNYKLENGESINEVSNRMIDVFKNILNENKNKNIAIVSHGTALTSLLNNFCEIKLNEETKLVEIKFDNELIFDGKWNCPELFKLEFDDNNKLINIKNIKIG